MVDPSAGNRVVWERRAVLKSGRKKIPGTLAVTAAKLVFTPLISGTPVTVALRRVVDVECVGSIKKKMKVTAGDMSYVFSIREAHHVASLVRSLSGGPQGL